MIDAARPQLVSYFAEARKMSQLLRQNTMLSCYVLHVGKVVSLQQQKDNAG